MKEIIERAERLGYRCMYNCINPSILYEEYMSNEKYIELCLIQKWLREEKEIYIGVNPIKCSDYSTLTFYIEYDVIFYNQAVLNKVGLFMSYDQALKEGIKKAIEILEKNI